MARLGISADRADEEAFDRYRAQAHAQLDEATWRAEWEEGSHLDLEEAAAIAGAAAPIPDGAADVDT
jgi:hypothetical protein